MAFIDIAKILARVEKVSGQFGKKFDVFRKQRQMCMVIIAILLLLAAWPSVGMSLTEKQQLREQVKNMFLHGYKNYKESAFPADELMPLSCKGRYRGSEPPRGDIDDALGNFSLTMIDSLDSLFLLSELDEFESAVRAVSEQVSFNTDVTVSVFETNIRILGGLLGAHVAAIALKNINASRMSWYTDQLLRMAEDVGNRLLPAFNTSTGIPYPRINLRYGYVGSKHPETNTCTACAGTMILEFAALSRLTGNPIFENKAVRALAYLWQKRNRHSDLVGTVIDVHNGDWIRRESGVGAGIDSYYEYLLKAYILLGEPVYFHRFHTHYQAIQRYIGGPATADFPFIFLDVHMHRPSERARTFMDSLLAFWPGLQVMSGDVRPAVALHEMLYQVHKRHKLLPEAFTPDLNVHWGQHLLRPEFIESTYLLYRATGDPYYLNVGAQVVADLQKYTRVPCGFAAINDVRTMMHVDQFDSFVLAETFKYLYLLFTEPSDLPINLDDYVLTTEAHLLPLSLSQLRPTPAAQPKSFTSHESHHRDSSLSTASWFSTPSPLPEESGRVLTDHHGDRDVIAEVTLHHQASCMAPNLDQLLSDAHSLCAKIPDPTVAIQQPDLTFNNDQSMICDSTEGPGVHRGRRFWQLLTNKAPHNCAPSHHMVKTFLWHSMDRIRQPLRQFADQTNQTDRLVRSTVEQHFQVILLRAAEFQPGNIDHLRLLTRMGIHISFTKDNRLQLSHDSSAAESPSLALSGHMFIQDMIRLSEQYKATVEVVEKRAVSLLHPPHYGRVRLTAGPARFGMFPGEDSVSKDPSKSVSTSSTDGVHTESESAPTSSCCPLVAPVLLVNPPDACSPLASEGHIFSLDDEANRRPLSGAIGVVKRGNCLFIEKARNLAKAGAVGGIAVDNVDDTSATTHSLFTMSGDADQTGSNSDAVRIPFVFLYALERDRLLMAMRTYWEKTKSTAMIMISKRDDVVESFVEALNNVDTPQTYEDKPDHPGAHQLLTRLQLFATPPGLPELELKSEASVHLKLTRLSNAFISDSDDQATQSENSVNRLGFAWRLTFFVPDNDLGTYYKAGDHPGRGHAEDPQAWLNVLDGVMDRIPFEPNCRGFISALVEVGLVSASPRNTSLYADQAIILSARWTLLADHCLSKLSDMCDILHAAYVVDNVARLNNFNEVSLYLNFISIDDDVNPMSASATPIDQSVQPTATKSPIIVSPSGPEDALLEEIDDAVDDSDRTTFPSISAHEEL